MTRATLHTLALLLPVLALNAACEPRERDDRRPPTTTTPPGTDRTRGATEFVSADLSAGSSTDRNSSEGEGEFAGGDVAAPPSDAAPDDDGTRSVEEGDIYRVMGNGLIANLNSYRGLQLIDVSNVDAPSIIGRLQISGYPVEMYVDGDRVIILMNDWHGYYGIRAEVASYQQQSGGVVAVVNIADPQKPVLVDQAYVPGSILKSRLTKGNVSRALYVAASQWESYESVGDVASSGQRTVVKSFDVSGGSLVEQSELDLGGWVTDIQATPRALLVARHDWSYVNNVPLGSRVAVIDISSPDGVMVEGSEVQVAGYVQNQFRMHLQDNILRVASGAGWGSTPTNHIETFLAEDLTNITPVDHVTFGRPNEDLYATLFLEDRAFAVTYFRTDPFHAFSITPDGFVTEESEFIVSGWNDFFKPTFEDTRLLGIGVNDEDGSRAMSVSLYDITDLTNANPLVARADVEADYSWSEASWDHRAFSVIEDAVDVAGPDGVRETGLVLLPFSGFSGNYGGYSAAVQIFTFSATSLTRRGLMDHGSQVRRSFNAAEGLTANLSESEMSLFDTSSPDTPTAHGRVELAPDATDLLIIGDHAARVLRKMDDSAWWYSSPEDFPDSVVELVPLSEDPDTGAAVARIKVPANAQLFAAGTTLVVATSRVLDTSVYPYVTETHVQTWDLSDPTAPVSTGELTTDRLNSANGWYDVPVSDCWDCGRYWGGYNTTLEAKATDDAIAFLKRTPQQELLGRIEVCSTYAENYSTCDQEGVCTYIEGGISCSQPEGEQRQCSGGFQRCTQVYSEEEGTSYWTCEPVAEEDIETRTDCWQNDNIRYWTSFSVEVLDVRGQPRLLDTIALDDNEEGVGLVADGDSVWLSTKRPVDLPGAALPFVRYFAHALDLSDLDAVEMGPAINVPGELLAVSGSTILTKDYVYGEDMVETSVNRLTIDGDVAVLEANHTFERDLVMQVLLDGAGRALVTHQLAWQYIQTEADYVTRMTILDADGNMRPLGTSVVDSWASLMDARQGRALFQVPGGLLVFNVEDAANPWAQAFFALRGWPTRIVVEGDDAIVPAGPYGIYRFALDTFNLLAPES